MPYKEIIVIGSLHYDIFLKSKYLPRIGETVAGIDWYPKLGGKGGNQAIAASLNSVSTKLISAVGKDDFSNYILENLEKKKIDTKYIQKLENFNSGMSVAISDKDGDYGAVIVSGANLNIDTTVLNDQSLWVDVEILMLQNEIDENTNIEAAKKAKEYGVKVFYNAAPAKEINLDLYKLVDILLVNTVEAEDITKQKILDLEGVKNSSKILSKMIPVVIISAGKKGVVLCEKNKEPIHFQGLKVNVKSTHGAGDTFAGTFCASLVLGKDLLEAIKIANQKAAEFIS
jgi:ribokinase